MTFSIKKIQSTAFLSLFLLMFISLAYFVINKYSLIEFDNPIFIFWIGFAFLTGLLQFSSRNVFPFLLSIASDKNKTRSRRIVSFSIGVIASLLSIGIIFSYLGDFIKSINLDLDSYFYLIAGIVTFVVTLSSLRLVNFNNKRNIPGIFNKNANLFNLFIIGFCFSLLDLIPMTAIISAKVLSVGSISFGGLLFLIHAFGRVVPVVVVDVLNRVNQKTIDIAIKIRPRMDYINNLLLLVVSTAFIHIGLISIIESNLLIISPFIKKFINDGWLLLFLWIIPLWIKYFYEEDRVYRSSLKEFKLITQKIKEIESECDELRYLYNFNDKILEKRIADLKKKLVQLSYDGKIIESCLRHSAKYPVRSFSDQSREEKGLKQRLIMTVITTILAVLFITILNI